MAWAFKDFLSRASPEQRARTSEALSINMPDVYTKLIELQKGHGMELDRIPQDVWAKILPLLDLEDVVQLSQTCRQVHDLALLKEWVRQNDKHMTFVNSETLLSWVAQYGDIARTLFVRCPTDEDVHWRLRGELRSESYLRLHTTTKLNAVSFCHTLETLTLHRMPYLQSADLKILASLPRLNKLTISHCNRLKSTETIASFEALRTLSLEYCAEMVDIRPLTACRSLEELNVVWCKKVIDLSALESYPPLRKLSLRRSKIDNIGYLQTCAPLRTIDLYSCKRLTELVPLRDFTELESLDLTNCSRISDLSPVGACTKLQELTMRNCSGVISLEPLRQLTNLEVLIMPVTNIYDLSPLESCPKLRILNIQGCKLVSDLTPLGECSELERLHIDMCKVVSNLRPLRQCLRLHTFTMRDCIGITELHPLAACQNLEILNLEGCHRLDNVLELTSCRNLRAINIKGSKIRNVRPLQTCDSLVSLTLESESSFGKYIGIDTLAAKGVQILFPYEVAVKQHRRVPDGP